ncbi:MAG: DNA-formamidopyrimidine glycosylase family protein [Pseudomonadota bacterium]
MPEGPTIVILREQAAAFVGKTILNAEGNAKIEMARLINQPVIALRSWGKHFLIELPDVSLRIHFLLFGSYLINERKSGQLRLSLQFADGELNFYACSVRFIEGKLDHVYKWSEDVMSEQWDPAAARRKLRAMPGTWVCDAMLDQTVFSGVGNIIKNEVLFRIRVHPLSLIGALPDEKLDELIQQARQYSFEFLEWKKAYVLKKHWLAHTKSICPRCNIPFSKGHLGKTDRRSFYCENCQIRYDNAPAQLHIPAPRTTATGPAAKPQQR